MAHAIKSKPLVRSFKFNRDAIDEKARTIDLAFASEEPADQWFGREILEMSEEAMDMTRLRDGAPVLINHDPDKLVGVVESATIVRGSKAKALVRFGNSPLAEEEFKNVLSGIRTKVSFGYRIRKMVKQSEADGVATFRVTDFQPLEISLVSIPADNSVGVGRSQENAEENNITIEESKEFRMNKSQILLDPAVAGAAGGAAATATATIQVDPKDTLKAERLRVSEIEAIAQRCIKHNPGMAEKLGGMVSQAKENGNSVEEFRKLAFESSFDAKPITVDPNLGMSRKELKEWSFVRAINKMAMARSGNGAFDGIEREASEATAKLIGKTPTGFFIPNDVLVEQRALQTNVFSGAGAFVDTTLQTGSFIEMLRNRMLVNTLGARSLSGLVGNVAIPLQSGGGTTYWLPEAGTVTVSAQTVGQLSLTPHRLSAATAYTKDLLAQSSVDVESFVRTDLLTILAIEKDRAALNGAGAGGEPLGIINTSGLSTTVTLTNASTCTYANALSAEGNIATSNADMGALAFVATVATRAATRAQQRFSSTDSPIWAPDNTIIGYPAKVTNQMPSTTSFIFGNWQDLILADWAGIDVVVDPYSLSLQAQIRVVLNLWTDIGIRHAKSFLISNQ